MAEHDAAATRRRRRSSTGMGGISALPDHLQHEVFSLVGDVKSLFRFAATCRGWLRRFTDAAFLRELGSALGRHHRARLLGVFLKDRWFNPWDKALVPLGPTRTMPAPRRRRRRQRASSSSSPSSPATLEPVFFPAPVSLVGVGVGGGDDDGAFDCAAAQLLAARRGIVLLQLAPRTPDEKDRCHLRLAVCNPVTGDRHVLPLLEWDLAAGCTTQTLVGYAIITAADYSSGGNGSPARFSQLVIITKEVDRDGSPPGVDAHLHTYSAATHRWSAPTTTRLDRRVFTFTLVGDGAAVVHRGAAHWLFVDGGLARLKPDDGDDRRLYRLSVEVATARVSLTRLPVPVRVAGKQLLFVNSDGRLAVAGVYPVHVTVWTPPAGGDVDGDGDDDTTHGAAAALWPRTSFRIASRWSFLERWWNFNHGSLVGLFRGGGGGVLIVDLETKVMEEVSIVDFGNKAKSVANKMHWSCVPYEMDLVEFFTCQLGGIPERLGTTTSETEFA